MFYDIPKMGGSLCFDFTQVLLKNMFLLLLHHWEGLLMFYHITKIGKYCVLEFES